MYAGRAESQKKALAEEITRVVTKTLGHDDEPVSVSIEDVAPKDWADKVYRPGIVEKPEQLYKGPGYNPL